MSAVADFDVLEKRHPVKRGEPTWDIAQLFPFQGHWTEHEYLALNTNLLIELSEGCVEFLPMPNPFHQRLAQLLFLLLRAFVVAQNAGEVFIAPLRVRLWSEKIRMPDIVFVRPDRIQDPHEPPNGADLAMEVVSESKDDRDRDLVVKREEYARAGIAEYWIVDPEENRITVLVLQGTSYVVHGEFTPGTRATSVTLPGFGVDVTAVFDAGNNPPAAAPRNGQ